MDKSTNQPSANELAQERTELAQERTEFAKYRTRQAADRTLMAWMRTSLSLISFGFGIPTIVDAIENTQATKEIKPEFLIIFIGFSFILIGVFCLINALKSHRHMLKAIRSGDYTYPSSDTNTTEKAVFALILVGVISFIGLFIRVITS